MPSRPPTRLTYKAALLPLLLVACTDSSRDVAPASPSAAWPIKRPPFMQAALENGGTETAGDGARRPDAAGPAVAVDPQRSYGLVELIDLAQRSNPETRDAWERARQGTSKSRRPRRKRLPATDLGGSHRGLPARDISAPCEPRAERNLHFEYARVRPAWRSGELLSTLDDALAPPRPHGQTRSWPTSPSPVPTRNLSSP